MFINPKTVLLSLLGLTPYLATAQVGYASLNGGITISGIRITVNTCSALKAAVSGSVSKIITISAPLVGCGVIDVGSNTFIVGSGSNTVLVSTGFRIKNVSKVVIRNITFKTPPTDGADAISIDASTNVWIDHCVFESDMDHDKDYYDGLIDITHGSDWITVSWCKFRNHFKGSLIGHSDSNASEDTGKLHVTYHHNFWNNINSRLPSVRFGTAHIFSSCYLNIGESGINARMGAIVRVEQCYFQSDNDVVAISTNLYSATDGYVQLSGNILSGPGAVTTSITQTTSLGIPYPYTLTPASQVCVAVLANAGVGIATTLP